MDVLYSFSGAVCVAVSTCGLLTEKYKAREYSGLIVFVALMGMWGLDAGQVIGVFMFSGVLIILLFITKRHRVENLCLACLGYLINLVLNNITILCVSVILNVSVAVIERKYYLFFSIFYIAVLFFTISIMRFLLYKKLHLLYYIDKMRHTARNGLLINLAIYIVIFILNIYWGQKAGYSMQALYFNCMLFFVCLISSNWLIFVCIKSVKSEEVKKAELEKRELMESYILCLEGMIDETKAFRHDYKNMMSTMAGFIYDDQMDALKTYFDTQLNSPTNTKNEEMRAWQYLKNIQPMELKGFLFEKVLTAFSKKIDIRVEISEELNLDYEKMGNLIRILGIFIDNAIEESEKINGRIEIVIAKTEEGVLFRTANEYIECIDISRIFDKGYSTKGRERGLGLYVARMLMRSHEDMFHECIVENGQFIQQLEIIIKSDDGKA